MVVEYDCPIDLLSSHREKINLEILRLQESEELVTWKRRWWVDKGQCSGESSQVRAALCSELLYCSVQYVHYCTMFVLVFMRIYLLWFGWCTGNEERSAPPESGRHLLHCDRGPHPRRSLQHSRVLRLPAGLACTLMNTIIVLPLSS